MLKTLLVLPFPFWVAMLVLAIGAVNATRHFRDGSGLPILAVLGTVTAWYVGDAFYNNYAGYHAKIFEADALRNAWWEVAWFLLVFLVAAPLVHRRINRRYIRRGSGLLQLFKQGVSHPTFQRQLNRVFYGCAFIWVILTVVAIVSLRSDAIYFFFPFLGYVASPWAHARIGHGFDFLSVLGVYFQILVAAIFGVVLALATNKRVRHLALFCCLTSWPYFVFGRTRNVMLAISIPAILSWVFLRLRGSMLKRFLVLGTFFLLVNAWMGFVISNRSRMSIVQAFREKGLNLDSDEEVHHAGLNMYEELCWINTFIKDGTYLPNWGYRYYAELVNPIPRALWPGKPLIGIKYAIARGMAGGTANQAGIQATIETGLIGQGVVNFGRILGPAAAALLMSFWVAVLARLDLRIQEFGRLPLYAVGIILTFNTGRDISFITMYPFVFGELLVWWIERRRSRLRPPPQSGAFPRTSKRPWQTGKTVAGPSSRRRRLTWVRTFRS